MENELAGQLLAQIIREGKVIVLRENRLEVSIAEHAAIERMADEGTVVLRTERTVRARGGQEGTLVAVLSDSERLRLIEKGVLEPHAPAAVHEPQPWSDFEHAGRTHEAALDRQAEEVAGRLAERDLTPEEEAQQAILTASIRRAREETPDGSTLPEELKGTIAGRVLRDEAGESWTDPRAPEHAVPQGAPS